MYDIWNGTICFESISIPVRVRLAAAPISIRLKKLHSCGEPIRQRIFCANCGEITGSETKRGLAVGKGQFVTVTKEELEACRPNSYSLMTVDQCVLPQDVPFELIQSTYYLEPSSDDTLA